MIDAGKIFGRRNKNSLPAVVVVLALTLSLLLIAAPARLGAQNPDGTIYKPVKGYYPTGASFFQAHLTASDIDGDGKQEILAGNTNGVLYCFNAKAELRWAYGTGGQIQGAPACYDVDGDGKKEVWVGNMNGVMWGFDCNGQPLTRWGWPKQTPDDNGFVGIFSSPAIGDINGDGAAEIVVGTYGHHVFVWNFMGGVLPGWPYDNKDTIWSSPALADLDRDGLKEIIIGGDSTGGSGWHYPAGGLLYAFNGDGGMVPGFPRMTPEVTWSSPVVSDIDGDGLYEIVVGTGHYYKATHRLTSEGHKVYAYNHDGSDVPGWPVTAAGSTFSSPAIGDIDRDGTKEVVIACNGLYGIGEDHIMAIKPDGRVMWDVRGFAGPNMGSPCLGDVTGDGLPEAIMGSGWAIGAWDPSGKVVWNQPLDNFVVTSPVVGDFDGDGRIEAAVATGDAPGGNYPGGGFYVFDCCSKNNAVTSNEKEICPWSMFRFNDTHSATVLTGNEPPPPPPPPPPANFYEYILLMNPGAETAHATLEFMNEKAEKVAVPWAVGPGSRSTVLVNRYMAGCGVSAKVTSDVPIICERAMYFNFQGRWKGGTDSIGAQKPAKNWYLAEGYTADNFDEYVLVQNPEKSGVQVNMTFMREGAGPLEKGFDLAPESRFTLNLKSVPGLEHTSVSTKVEATGDVICERSMYFNYNGNIGGHDSIGVTEPSEHWYLAEGYTAQSYDTYVLVQNPGGEDAAVDVSFLRSDGYQSKVSFLLPQKSRKTVKVDDVPGFEAAEVSTEVTSSKGVVAERAVYFNAGGRDGGHESIGVREPADRWYLPEGYTGGSFDTYVLIMNPSDGPATAKTTFLRSDGYSWSRVDNLLPRSRFTIHVDEMPGFDNAEVSTLVEAQGDTKVIAERAMYFVYDNKWADGHDSIGVNSPSTTWYFAEGYTGL